MRSRRQPRALCRALPLTIRANPSRSFVAIHSIEVDHRRRLADQRLSQPTRPIEAQQKRSPGCEGLLDRSRQSETSLGRTPAVVEHAVLTLRPVPRSSLGGITLETSILPATRKPSQANNLNHSQPRVEGFADHMNDLGAIRLLFSANCQLGFDWMINRKKISWLMAADVAISPSFLDPKAGDFNHPKGDVKPSRL
jgi:hypothetical protein